MAEYTIEDTVFEFTNPVEGEIYSMTVTPGKPDEPLIEAFTAWVDRQIAKRD